MSWEDYLKLDTAGPKDMLLAAVANIQENELRKFWDEGHGVCTSWAITMIHRLEKEPGEGTYWDDGTHRLAVTSSSIVVDSSNREAAKLEAKEGPGIPRKISYFMSEDGHAKAELYYVVC